MPPLWKTEELNLSTLQEVKSQISYANLILHLKSDKPSWFTAIYRTSQLERNPVSVQTFRALHHPCPINEPLFFYLGNSYYLSLEWHPAFHLFTFSTRLLSLSDGFSVLFRHFYIINNVNLIISFCPSVIATLYILNMPLFPYWIYA